MSIYKTYSNEQIENLFSQFLISSWSFSKISEFSRNEKAFEMSYIYGIRSKSSASTVAGQAYHHALDVFFTALKKGETLDLVELESLVYEYIDTVEANKWKLQKTTPTIAECIAKTSKISKQLVHNFYKEKGTYIDHIEEILEVEVYCDEFITVNGVDIPLPCHARIDLIIKTKEDKIVAIDHKSRNSFTKEEDIKLIIGRQTITYIKCYESKTKKTVDEVWFIENKHTTNRNGAPQMNAFKLAIDKNVRKLYEALLYEPLKRMLEAVNDPDYTYMINDADNFVDKAELYDFWAKTQIAEVGDFNIDPTKKELVSKRLKKIRDTSMATINPKIIKEFKKNAAQFIQYDLNNKNMTQEEKIQHILRTFGYIVEVAHTFHGFSCSTYLLNVSAGIKINSINSIRLDIANALNVNNIRISTDLMVYQKKSYVAIEAPKERTGNLLYDPKALVDQKIPLGMDNLGNVIHWDLNNHATAHMLVCGATGSGKSVLLQCTIEYAKRGLVNRIIILDTKSDFEELNIKGVEIYNTIEDIEIVMRLLVEEMQNPSNKTTNKTLIVFDEFADAQAQSAKGKALEVYETQEVGNYANGKAKLGNVLVNKLKPLEENLRLLLQKGRSYGFRIVAATQRASTKIITGDAKANFPVLVCFKVPKEVDSRVVIDETGAETLAGYGDGLIKSPEYFSTTRFQAYYKPKKGN